MKDSPILALAMWILIPVILIASIWFLSTDRQKLKPAPVSDIENTGIIINPLCELNEDMRVRNCICDGRIAGGVCKEIKP